MLRTTTLISFVALAGCASAPSQKGVGFTGIGEEQAPFGASQNSANPGASYPVQAQREVTGRGNSSREALFRCTDEAGITGAYSSTYTYSNGREQRVVNVDNNVSEEQARIANQCIAAG